ncbi:caspase family protein [Citreicoccus inhibens]|uniref:caspase family protein n=1 Tax=Citreicoccus inhibens TaxID=2849499 RepID=UPI001EF1093B|nr:caspase family protein [Citreicoccus inhibens]
MGWRRRAAVLALGMCLLGASGALAAPQAEEAGVTLRRFALVVGSSEGGAGRDRLRYAGSDALAVSRVLGELGGVAPVDQVLLLEADRAALVAALGRMKALVDATAADHARRELVLYYSGHSDADGLLPRGERLPYEDLRRLLGEVSVDVRIAILDSCGSGALTRSKGGLKRPAFLTDASSQVRGHAYLASSSADEVAQESDTLGASFFTHFLVSGLRGAADGNADGRVTLHEAYQFAFHETLARTERSQGGPQHAAYDIQLAGSGDVVLTDLRGSGARLSVAEDVDGRLFVRNWGNQLVAELQKLAGRRVALGLEPGRYHVTLERPLQRFEAELSVSGRDGGLLRAVDFVPVTLTRTASRGGKGTEAPLVATTVEEDVPRVALNVSLVPPLSTSSLWGGRGLNHVALGALAVRSSQLRGVGLSGGVGWVDGTFEGLQLSGLANVAGGESRGVQLAFGANLAFADSKGLQAAGLVNVAHGSFTGLQMGVTANRADGLMSGMQAAIGINVAQRLSGVQLGLFNMADDATGVQVGLVNVGGVMHGLQLGMLNIADDVTVPIGILSIVKRGRLVVELAADDISPVSMGLKYGNQRVYVLVTAGLSPWAHSYRLVTMVGMGMHLPLGAEERYSLDADIAYGGWSPHMFGSGPSNSLYRLRAVMAWELKRRFALFAGPMLHYYRAPQEDEDRGISWMPQFEVGSARMRNRMWPGLVVGVRI